MKKQILQISGASLLAFSCVLAGCSKADDVSLEDATEVALDDSNNTTETASNIDAKEQDGEYVVQFNVDNGQYTYTLGKDGIIRDCVFDRDQGTTTAHAPAEQQPAAPVENTNEQQPKEAENPTEEGVVSEQDAVNAALANAGLEEADVSELSVKLNKKKTEYTVEFVYGDARNQVTVNAETGEVISSIFI
ncbi:PepSY domain-containing protein [uncultured Dubosiella sp.]|uniref:PepSY domain-containing protein n=1 Tax=uncultured Dubosiella sp. TaxID=1937011 RepID=UPI002585E97D|nr:PepSY domain-containing protein [uncultured Dubosiella sp.]